MKWSGVASNAGTVVREGKKALASLEVFETAAIRILWMVADLAPPVVSVSVHSRYDESSVKWTDCFSGRLLKTASNIVTDEFRTGENLL